MQLKENYDLVVLGDHVGSLWVAALVTRLDLSVLVLPFGDSLKTFISRQVQGDYEDCLDPESNFLIGAASRNGEFGLIAHCLSYFEKWIEGENRIDFQKGLPQVLGSTNRFSLTFENDSFDRELNREFGNLVNSHLQLVPALHQAEAGYSKYWRNFPDRLNLVNERSQKIARQDLMRGLYRSAKQAGLNTIWEDPRKKISQLKEIRKSDDLSEALLGLSYGLISHVSTQSSIVASEFIERIALARTGASFKGGISTFRDLLKKVVKKQGADFLEDSKSSQHFEFQRLIVSEGKLIAVEITESAQRIASSDFEDSEKKVHTLGVRAGALGCSLTQLKEKVLIQKRSWLKKLKDAPMPMGWRFTICLQVKREAICPGMSQRMIWKEKDSPPLEIETAFPSDYVLTTSWGSRSRADDSYRLIFLRTVMPYTSESLSPSYQKMIAARMMRQVFKLVPFIDRHLLKVFPDFQSTSFEADVLKVYPMQDLGEIPVNLRCYSEKGIGSDSGIDGLFVVSDEAYPQLGSLGTVIASLEATAWLAHQSGRTGPFG